MNLERWIGSKGTYDKYGKTKILTYHEEKMVVQKSGKWPCGVCGKGVGQNSIKCASCKHWIHQRCSGVKGRLVGIVDFKCKNVLLLISVISRRRKGIREGIYLGK